MPELTVADDEIIKWVNLRLTAVLLAATGVVIGGDVGAVATGDIIYADSTPLWSIRTAGAQDTILIIDAGGVPVWTAEMPLASLADPTRGDVMIGNATPEWSSLAIGGDGTYLRSDGSDPAWSALQTADLPDLPTPGTLTVSTANSGTAPHLHTITTSSSPGAAASILASAADGGLQLIRFGIGADPSVDGQLYVYENTASTVPKLLIEQDGAGDAAMRWLLTAGDEFSMGIANSIAGNPLIISAGNGLADTPLVALESSGNLGLGITNPDRTLNIYTNDSSTAPALHIEQDGTGDVGLEFELTAGQSVAMGIDNSESRFQIAYSSALGGDTGLFIDGSGVRVPQQMEIGEDDITSGRLFVYGGSLGGEGGEVQLYLTAVHDGTFQSWNIDVLEDDLRVFSSDAAVIHTFKSQGRFELAAELSLPDGQTAPGAVTGRASIYVDSADGDLKVKFADGFVAVIAADS